jgi:hypothetical protein
MSVIDSSTLLASGTDGYQISRSLRFDGSAYLNRTPASAGSRRIATWSGWIKLGNHSSTGEYYLLCTNGTSDSTFFYIQIRNNQLRFGQFNSGTFALYSTQLFRDPSAWYHIVVAVDTTQATASNRAKAYVNGTEITSWSTANYPAQNNDLGINDTRAHAIGAGYASGSPYAYWDGSVTETYLIDGQALTPSSFGETDTITGVWKPKRYAGTYSGNSFYLNFSDNSGTTSTTLGKDSSGLGNNFTPSGFSVTAGAGNDSMIDTPTPYADGGNGRGNYCTLNPLTKSSTPTPSDGNLVIAFGGTYPANVLGTMGVSSGKWYWEVLFAGGSGANGHACGVAVAGWANRDLDPGSYSTPYSHYIDSRQYFANNSVTTNNSTSFTSGDIIGVALNVDSNQVSFYLNGSLVGSAQSLESNQTWFPFHKNSSYTSLTQTVNFGQRPFAYTPPSGFVALNTQNLPEPSIKKPGTYFNTVLWTGNGTSQSITGVGFQTDLLWSKARNQAYSHRLHDAVRGREQSLLSNSTGAEFTQANSITSFDADGFTVGSDGSHNGSGATYVGWCWDESATPGFDIVTYTGDGTTSANRLIDHSLGVKPDFVITKKRSGGTDYGWSCWHKDLGGNYGIWLDKTSARNVSMWSGYSNFSSTKFTPPDLLYGNENGATYVNYLWSEVANFSRFGSYVGNGSSDGPAVWCGFRPRWVLIKSSTVATSWYLFDAVRGTINANSTTLYPNTADIEDTNFGQGLDFLSNGFKVRAPTGYGLNNSSATYIFCAFSETPFKYALAR